MSAVVERVTTRWRLTPPVLCDREWRPERGQIEVHIVERDVEPGGEEYWSVKGVPLTKTGKPNGGIDHRSITDADQGRLIQLVIADAPFPEGCAL